MWKNCENNCSKASYDSARAKSAYLIELNSRSYRTSRTK